MLIIKQKMSSSGNLEELRRKFSISRQKLDHPPVSRPTASAPMQYANAYDQLSVTVKLSAPAIAINRQPPEHIYLFPGTTNITGGGSAVSDIMVPNTYGFSSATPVCSLKSMSSRGHTRSVSHGGGAIVGLTSRPIKSALKGHQRAFSHGQIMDTSEARIVGGTRGHCRVGSKTDFVLPPGHKEGPESREFGLSVPNTTAGRGHSRQASRSESIYTLRHTEIKPWWKRMGICHGEKFEEHPYRIVVPNHIVPPKTPKRDHPNGLFLANKIRTTKYTLLSFIPKNFLEQFHRVANLYFIFIVLLNWFPAINAFGKEVAMIPVLFVLGVTAVKDLFEDRRRRSSDKRINNTTCRVYNGEHERYKKIKWQDIRVGDIVHLSNNETVPADILLLRSSDPHGVCYIDTCDLDGETNLKRREVVRGFTNKQSIFQPSKFISRIEADAPTTKLYKFRGALIHPTGERIPVSTDNLLLRESRLKNTDFVEAIVVYAGHETKSMLNNSGPRYKRSQVEQQMNVDIIWCVIILLILCAVGAVGCKMWLSSFQKFPVPYLAFDIDPDYEGLLTFWTYIIILQVMIPLSLYVTIELCKILQVYHIHNNIDLYDFDTNKKTECRAMNITEELGQIQHIFSDKTGTLTENKMIFRRCVINGQDYNHPATNLENTYNKLAPPTTTFVTNSNLVKEISNLKGSAEHRTSQNAQTIQEFLLVMAICNTVIVSAGPHRDLMNASGVIEMSNGLIDGEKSFNTTDGSGRNSVVSTISQDHYRRLTESPLSNIISPMKPHTIVSTIAAPSPINGSIDLTPHERPPMESKSTPKALSPLSSSSGRGQSMLNSITTLTSLLNTRSQSKGMNSKSKIQGKSKEFQIPVKRPLYEAESPDELALVNAACTYNCTLISRTPNNILVSQPSGVLNDFEILKLLPFDSSRKCMSIVVRNTATSQITLYIKGADTSIMPSLKPCAVYSPEAILRDKTQQELDRYAREGLRILVMAKRDLSSTEYTDWWASHQEIETSIENQESRIRESFANLESNLTLLGATGIEDRLQEGVPETITTLLSAGISLWVLTGDKPETAINIAYSAKLFSPQMELIRLTARSRDAAESAIKFYLSELTAEKSLAYDMVGSTKLNQRALIVDGKTLTFVLDLRSKLIRPFLKLAKNCASVLCCRSTPLQKAYLVKVVKEELNLRTLAIGDGANDVSMIQMADVGVGISGQEGMQAVMAADFTLARFRYLEKLLLVHGHWCYDRLARMILYFFYKNAAFVFLIFWYQLYCGFSGSVMIDQMYLMLYNLIFTALPPLAIGVYEKKVAEDLLLKYPYLYKNGRLGLAYRPHDFWLVLLDALYQSLVIFFVSVCTYADSDVDIFLFGSTITVSCLYANLVHAALEIRSWTILHVLSIIISLVSFYAFSMIYNSMCVKCFGLPSSYWVIFHCFSSPIHWLIILLSTVVAIVPRLLFITVKTSIYPDDSSNILIQNKRHCRRESPIVGLRIKM